MTDQQEPGVDILGEAECRALIAKEPVGRLGYVTDDGRPMIVPVDFLVSDDVLMFRSDPGDKLTSVPLRHVCFEADGNEGINSVWSVVVHGVARDVTTAIDDRYERLRRTAL